MKKIYILLVWVALHIFNANTLFAQVEGLTREKVLSMSTEELSGLTLDQLMEAIDVVGVSSMEELMNLIMNKNIVSASKSDENAFESALSSTVLSSREIEESGATSIEEALRLVPGVIVREKTNGTYDVQIRGNQNMPMNNMLFYAENSNTLVMVNGRPAFNYGNGNMLWETLPVSLGEVDRIEVVRGPATALYGPNAVSGVINIITKRMNSQTPLATVNFQQGNHNTDIRDLSIKKQVCDKLGVGVSTYYEYRDRNTTDIYAFPNPVKDDLGNITEIPGDRYVSLQEYAQLDETYKWSNDDVSESYDDTGLAKRKTGVNGYIEYKPTAKISLFANGGYMESKAITSLVGDNPTSYNQREATIKHGTLNGSIYGVNLKASVNNTLYDYNKGHPGWKMKSEQYNVDMDYLIQLGSFAVRPGLSYQSVYYDDRAYSPSADIGFFRDRIVLRNYAASARFDYTPIEALRLVAALRAEKYNVPDKMMPTYQFSATYKLNDNNLLRAVYSRANQSTFMTNAYSNYKWNRVGLGAPEIVHFGGADNPGMMVMDMLEVGYRTKPMKNLMLDFEAFYTKGKDYSALMPDSMSTVTFTGDPSLNPLLGQVANTTLHISYRDLELESTNYGVTLRADWIVSEKLIINGHVTYQQTIADNFMDYNRNQIAELQGAEYVPGMKKAIKDYLTYVATNGAAGANTPPLPYYSSSTQPDASEFKDNVKNEAVPSFWGSLTLTYKPIKLITLTTQAYYFDKYYIYTQWDMPGSNYATGHIDSKLSLNAKVSYHLSKKVDVFFNGRNILNNDSQEYLYMDNIGALYLGGVSIKL